MSNTGLDSSSAAVNRSGAKTFKVEATPTLIISGKKFEKALTYKNLKKYLEKLI